MSEARRPKNSSSHQVGDIVYSILDEATFTAVRDDSWVLMDGRDVSGSKYAQLTGITTLPDARGQFMRGKNNGRADGQENPDGDVAIGTFQGHQFGSHDHASGVGRTDGVGLIRSTAPTGSAQQFGVAAGSVNNEALSSSSGGNETRPRNITVNIFVKIN